MYSGMEVVSLRSQVAHLTQLLEQSEGLRRLDPTGVMHLHALQAHQHAQRMHYQGAHASHHAMTGHHSSNPAHGAPEQVQVSNANSNHGGTSTLVKPTQPTATRVQSGTGGSGCNGNGVNTKEGRSTGKERRDPGSRSGSGSGSGADGGGGSQDSATTAQVCTPQVASPSETERRGRVMTRAVSRVGFFLAWREGGSFRQGTWVRSGLEGVGWSRWVVE